MMDVVIVYLYRSNNNDVYMKILEGFKMPKAYNSNPQNFYSIKLQRFLYRLKQLGCMWYYCLSEYLLKEWYNNELICPCFFIKKSESDFAMIVVYIDDLNIIGTTGEIQKTLKKKFEIKYLGKTKFYLGLQIEHLVNRIIIH
jgi:hypothetical protein